VDLSQRIENIIESSVAARGYEIVRVAMNGQLRKTLQIMIDRVDGQTVTVDDCEIVSRLTSQLLDAEDPISGAYTLEVSSPGMERPLVKPAHFIKHCGKTVVIQTQLPIDNRKKFRGQLAFADERGIKILRDDLPSSENNELSLEYGDIRNAHLHIEF
jgi:ribosome maturation factor RimP